VKESAHPTDTNLHRTHRHHHHQDHLDKGLVDMPSILPEAFGHGWWNLTVVEHFVKKEAPPPDAATLGTPTKTKSYTKQENMPALRWWFSFDAGDDDGNLRKRWTWAS
jgi:hypothetical protein